MYSSTDAVLFSCVFLWCFSYQNPYKRRFLDQLHSTKPTARVAYRRWRLKRTIRCFGVGSTSLNRLDFFISIMVRRPEFWCHSWFTQFIWFRCYVTPLLGAYIADTYWGRFKTICVAVVIALIGHVILIVSALPGVIEYKSAAGVFIVALIVMGFGMWIRFFVSVYTYWFLKKVPGCSRQIFHRW